MKKLGGNDDFVFCQGCFPCACGILYRSAVGIQCKMRIIAGDELIAFGCGLIAAFVADEEAPSRLLRCCFSLGDPFYLVLFVGSCTAVAAVSAVGGVAAGIHAGVGEVMHDCDLRRIISHAAVGCGDRAAILSVGNVRSLAAWRLNTELSFIVSREDAEL